MPAVATHPVAGAQVSTVHGLPSLQTGAGPPTHTLFAHLSAVVHALPSSQLAVFAVVTHPVAVLHESSVQGLPSLQTRAGPPTHTLAAHLSAVVQALPSSQLAVFAAFTHPVAGTQLSSVHGLLSLQFGAAPPTHVPAPLHLSFVVQALLSLQLAVFGVWMQPPDVLHVSVVHTSLSSQLPVVPAHVPLVHVSPWVQALLSLHGIPDRGVATHASVDSLHVPVLH